MPNGTQHDRPPSIAGFPLGDYQTNCYVVRPAGAAPDDPACFVVDCGYEPGPLIEYLERHSLLPHTVVLTHAHPDHIAGLCELMSRIGKIPIWIHSAEKDWLLDPEKNLSTLLGHPVTGPPADRFLTHAEKLTLGDEEWEVRHTPGHSPGGISLISHERSIALVGDTLFDGSIGRSDFPGSSFEVLADSIRTQLYTLPDDTLALPGHGPTTTIGKERQSNPFVTEI